MWNHIPVDVLSHIFSFLPPPSLACAASTCTHWRSCSASLASSPQLPPPWLLAFPLRVTSPPQCHALDPHLSRWRSLDLAFLPAPIRPLAPLGALLLCRIPSPSGSPLRLALCNPFTRQYRPLPPLRRPRSSPAIGVVPDPGCIYVAGGMSPGGDYEPTVEVYDGGRWEPAGAMPAEFAVRLTVWTPGEGVHAAGEIYWMTSARAFSIVAFDVARRSWREVRAPMADRLEWAALVALRGGRVGVVGGAEGKAGEIWELEGERWRAVGSVCCGEEPAGRRRRGGKGWGCAGADGVIYMFRDLNSKILVCRGRGGDVGEWESVEGANGSSSIGGGGNGVAIKGVMIYPSLSHCRMHSFFPAV